MSSLAEHPAAAIFPMMSDEAVRALAADIKRNGLVDPIVVLVDGATRLVLDGRNRLRACAIAGVEPRFVAFDGADPFAFVVSKNLERRHMTTAQRAMVAAEMANLKHGSNRHIRVEGSRDPSTTGPTTATSEAARLLDVSEPTVKRARAIRKYGTPALVAAVVAGELAIKPAAMLARYPKCEQEEILAKGPEAVIAATRSDEAEQPPAPFVRDDGSTVKPVRGGVVRVLNGDVPPAKKADDHETVRALTESGYTVSDIANQTGLSKTFIHHARGKILPKKSVLVGAIEDAEVFAECWCARAKNLPASWTGAPGREVAVLIKALDACRVAATKAIQRLKKEAEKEASSS